MAIPLPALACRLHPCHQGNSPGFRFRFRFIQTTPLKMGNRSMNWNSKSRLHCKHCRHCWLTLLQPTFDTHRRTKSCSTLEVKCPSVQHLVGAIYTFPLRVLRGREEEVNAPCVVLVLAAWVTVQEGVRHTCMPHRFEVSLPGLDSKYVKVVTQGNK